MWSALGARLTSLTARASRFDGARLLHATAATVATVLAVLSFLDAATGLVIFAVRHESGPAGALMLTAAVLGLYTVITASAWRARLNGQRLPVLSWALWWIAVGIGLAATAAVADTWIGRGLAAAPMAVLAALTGLITRPPA